MSDTRLNAAKYYDLNPNVPDDIPFYRKMILSPEANVLELGCGTGRVLLSLIEHCEFIHGLDNSEAMLEFCRKGLKSSFIPRSKALITHNDITDFSLKQRFDLIIAPFRVFQNLETDAQVQGLLFNIKEHLKPNGRCILNVFNPKYSPEELLHWQSSEEELNWEIPAPDGRITCHDVRRSIDLKNRILYPQLIYREYKNDQLIGETILNIVMRCYYPDEFKQLIRDNGFRILNTWGGYHGEAYGEGNELIIQFCNQ